MEYGKQSASGNYWGKKKQKHIITLNNKHEITTNWKKKKRNNQLSAGGGGNWQPKTGEAASPQRHLLSDGLITHCSFASSYLFSAAFPQPRRPAEEKITTLTRMKRNFTCNFTQQLRRYTEVGYTGYWRKPHTK